MPETIRTFIAITLNPGIQDALKKIQTHLRKTGADVRWVKPENIHLTLKFLGETPLPMIEEMTHLLRTTVVGFNPFPCSLTHLGAFPKIEHPQVIWIGIQQGKTETTQIAYKLEDHFEPLGFKKEKRKFDAHVTLGRVRSGMNRLALGKEIKQYRLQEEISQDVDHLVFYKSTLTSQGPIYEVIAKVGFTASVAKSPA